MDNVSAKKSKRHLIFHNTGKLVLDMVKLSFGGLVLGSIIKWGFSPTTLLFSGAIISVLGAVIGIYMVIASEEK